MVNKNDWRLTNQENYLKNKELIFSHYTPPSKKWDHDHCEFCNNTFGDNETDLHEGYCTLDHYHWICKDCLNDFSVMFNWKVVAE